MWPHIRSSRFCRMSLRLPFGPTSFQLLEECKAALKSNGLLVVSLQIRL